MFQGRHQIMSKNVNGPNPVLTFSLTANYPSQKKQYEKAEFGKAKVFRRRCYG